MYSCGSILDAVARMAQRVGDADYRTRILDWVNLGHDYLANSYDYWAELQTTQSISVVADQEVVYLPSNFDKPFRLFDFTNNAPMLWITREEYVESNISTVSGASSGQPRYAMLYGVSAVARAISSGITLQAKSSSSADNTGVVVRVEGWLDSAKTILGYEDITISTSSPTTYATASSPSTFYGVTRVVKSADTTGYVTLADNSSNVLATISPDDAESRYPQLYLGPASDGSVTYSLLFKRKIKKMVNDNDYPFMDCADFLMMYATSYAYSQEKESEGRAKQMMDKAMENMQILLRNEQAKMGPNFQHKFVPLTLYGHRF